MRRPVTSEPERRRVNVGILGVGAVTQIVHLPMLSERPDVDVIAVSDPDRVKAEALGGRFDVTRVLSDEPPGWATIHRVRSSPTMPSG